MISILNLNIQVQNSIVASISNSYTFQKLIKNKTKIMSTTKKSKTIVDDAIADARALRETALANARLALEEAFAPKIKSIMRAQLNEDEDENLDENEEENLDETTYEEDENLDENDELENEEDLDEAVETTAGAISNENDLIKALAKIEKYVKEKGGKAAELVKSKLSLSEEDENLDENDELENEEDLDEEIDINSLLAEMEDDEDEDTDETDLELKNMTKQNARGAKTAAKNDMKDAGENDEELDEAHDTINTLMNEMKQMNLLNSKLLYTNKIFKNNNLNESQKIKILDIFDKAKTAREAKLIFNSLNENFQTEKRSKIIKSKSLTENLGLASRTVGKVNMIKKQEVINENAIVSRFQKLANIKK
jgi:hypothetical protein